MNGTNYWGLLALSLSGCLLGVDQLDAGAQDGAEVDGDGADWGLSTECLDGTPLPGEAELPAPECEVECATGWGHATPTLGSEWTLELDVAVPAIDERWDRLITLIDGSVLIAVSGDPIQFVWVSAEGEQYASLPQTFSGRVFDLDTAPGGSGDTYVLWENEGVVSLSSSYDIGEWTVELGPYADLSSTMVALDQGVAVALNLTGAPPAAKLMRVAGGEILAESPAPVSSEIAKTPSADVVLADRTKVSWLTADGVPITEQDVPGLVSMLGLAAVDDDSVVLAGATSDTNELSGNLSASIREVGQAELGWSATYDRADFWCSTPTDEIFVDLERLPDGSLIVGGFESPEYPFADPPSAQPWVAHVSATGEVIASDRGSWVGRVISISSNDDAAYVLMSAWRPEGDRLFVRKYPL